MIFKLLTSFAAAVTLSAAFAAQINLPQNPSQHEKNAADLLKKYTDKIDKNSKIIFDIAIDRLADKNSWSISSDGKTVFLKGGEMGIYLAVGHYLQDICGMMFYSPFEHEVIKNELPANFKSLSGKNTFVLNEIHSHYGKDNGDYALLRGLNNDGYFPISKRAGFARIFGRPYFVHTFASYIPAAKYFKSHPEWFAELNGKRVNNGAGGASGSQLCLSNREVRKELLKNLRSYIERDSADAKKKNVPPPWLYDISQNDNQQYCRCMNCDALAAKYGNSQSGLLLDFINEIAREIRKTNPELKISSCMYQYTEKIPTGIKPEPNVVIVLTDTLSNVLQPIGNIQNRYFYNLLKDWSKLSDNIRIWDYNITYTSPREMPYNSEWTYQTDMKFFRDNGVKQLFSEFEEPVLSDVRDYKFYLKTALQENPDADIKAVSKKFADNFYGKASDLFLQYRELLKKSQDAKGTFLGMYPPTSASTHLDLATVTAAQKLFDRGTELLKNDPVRLRRWNHARIGIDRASLIMARSMMSEYLKKNGSLKGYPLAERNAVAERILAVAQEQAAIRLDAKAAAKFMKNIKAEVKKYTAPITERSLHTPEIFKNIPAQNLFDFSFENSSRWFNYVELIDDPTSDIGRVACISFPHKNPKIQLKDYLLPILFGIYSPSIKRPLWGHEFSKNRITQPGYNWYKLGETKLSGDCYMFIFKSWNIKLGISGPYDMNEPDRKFEIWARIKFTGPSYPCGKADEKDAIYFERLMLVKK
ncbi:MAG: DUF4838 domain-containing protein [Lentisphaeria bacterium]|nr:DUF4838 domain-containing protein [Lentisphaeria bacterium]